MSYDNRIKADLASNHNIIEVNVWTAQPLENYDSPTMRVNTDYRPEYSETESLRGTSMLDSDDPDFLVDFVSSESMPETLESSAEAVMESDFNNHLDYGGKRMQVKMVPNHITGWNPSELGQEMIESADEFNINGV